MSAAIAAAMAQFACGVFVFAIGAAAAWVSSNAVKRVSGVIIVIAGALIALSALGAGPDILLAAIAAGLAYLAIGAAIAVRLQEAYDGVEIPDIDAADAREDARADAAGETGQGP
jgi:hypothetical protein